MKIIGTPSIYAVTFGEATSWWNLDLNRDATRVTSVTGVAHVQSGFKWNAGDEDTNEWLPQGLTGLQTTQPNQIYKFMVVSWYFHADSKGVRLSFVDTVDPRHYRHVLLVMPDITGKLKPLAGQHAGGIEIIGTRLYLADTSFGLREFDLEKIYAASNVSSFDAFDYRYIMPQVRSYDVSKDIDKGAGKVPRFSYLSRIWNDGTPQLLSGNFHVDGDAVFGNSPTRVCRWEVDQSLGSITQIGTIIQLNCQRVQGAVLRSKGGKEVLYLSRSYGTTHYKLYVVEVPADYNQNERLGGFKEYDWCNYSEDMHLSQADNLWCHQEKSSRKVFYVDPDDYLPAKSAKVS